MDTARLLALCFTVAAFAAIGCSVEPADPSTPVNIQAVQIGNKPFRCVPMDRAGMRSGRNEIKGDLRNRLLTQDAIAAGVRVHVPSSDVSTYGSTTLVYTDKTKSCMLWAESLGVQEWTERLGLTPIGISTGYVAQPPASTPTGATPAPVKPAQ